MAGSDQETRGGFGGQLSADTSTPRPQFSFPDSLLRDFREAYAKHGGKVCYITATPDDQDAPETCIGSVRLPPVAGFEQSGFWLSVGSFDYDDETAARDFLPLAARAGAYLPTEFRRRLAQPALMEPAALWCLAILRYSIERGHVDSTTWAAANLLGRVVALEWMLPYAASVELLERLQGQAPGADPRGGGAVETQQPQATPQDLQSGAVGKGQDAAAGSGGDESDAGKAGYSTPENYERDKWIYEQSKAGRTIPEIIRDLTERPEWYPLDSDNGIRDAVKRYANYAGLPVHRGRPGKPRGR